MIPSISAGAATVSSHRFGPDYNRYRHPVRRHQPGRLRLRLSDPATAGALRALAILFSMTAIRCIGICTGGGDAPGLERR